MPAVADGMQRRRRLSQVLADDAGVADLPVAEAQLEMRETDRPRIVGALGGLQRFGQERDAAGGFAAGGGQAAVHPPEVGQPGGIEPFAGFGRSPQGLGGLADVVLQQPGFRERAPDLDLLVATEPRPLERAHEQRRRVRAAPLLERPNGLAVEVRRRHGGDSIPRIQVGQVVNRRSV